MNDPLGVGERVLLLDKKGRRYLIRLSPTGQFHSHSGYVDHSDILGLTDGAAVTSNTGGKYTVVRPTLADFILKMPRGAQVIYPKDLGAMFMLADIYPGVRVLEAGVGSGSLSMMLLRAGATVYGYEIREDFAERAKLNVSEFVGEAGNRNYNVEMRDVYEGIVETELDRILLDLPEPWRVIGHAEKALRPGGILVSYSPSIMQVSRLHEVLDGSNFGCTQTQEVLWRTWHIEGQAVRPDHRMVAHTGFLTYSRLFAE